MSPDEVHAVAERVDARLASNVWNLSAADSGAPDVSAAAEVAVFALKLAGKRRQARSGAGASAAWWCASHSRPASRWQRWPRHVTHRTPLLEATAIAVSNLGTGAPDSVLISAPPRAGPAKFINLILLDAGSDAQPWAIMAPQYGQAPVLVDRVGAGLTDVGAIYTLAAQPVTVGTRDGVSQFLDPLEAGKVTGRDTSKPTDTPASPTRDQLVQRWGQDERYLAVTRAIAGQPTVLDAAYNAPAASAAGGTHTYLNGIVLRVEPDKPVLQVIDRALLESGAPTRAEDVVYVAIRASESSLYEPGQVVNLRDVVMDKQTTDVNGQPTTVYVANAALDGARVEPTDRVDLQALLQPRLQVVDQDLALQSQVASAAGTPASASGPQPTATPGGTTPAQPIIVQQNNNRGSSSAISDLHVADQRWLLPWRHDHHQQPGAVRRPTGRQRVLLAPANHRRDEPVDGRSVPVRGAQHRAGCGALVGVGTVIWNRRWRRGHQQVGGGCDGTRECRDQQICIGGRSRERLRRQGKSISSAPSGSSSTASRSAGSTSAGSRGSVSSSSGSSGGKGIGSSSGSSGGFGGKGISGGSNGAVAHRGS